MGGRGGSGGGRGGGLSLPSVSGSQKQVAYANDIMRQPYDRLGAAAKNAETLSRRLGGDKGYDAEAAAYRAAQVRYNDGLNAMAKRGGDRFNASFVIQKRFGFLDQAREYARQEFKARNLDTTTIDYNV